MYCRKAIPILLLALFGCFSSPADAQINLKTGYNFSIVSTPSFNESIADFNATQPYKSGFGKLTWLHGFEAGIRYKSGLSAGELTYQGAYQTLKANGQELDISYTDRIRTAVHSVGAGLQFADDIWGLGTDIQYQFYKVKFIPGQNGDTYRNVQNMLALKFYLMLTLKGGNGVDMAIQPYYILPFKEYDNSPFAQHLQVEPVSTFERWDRFGITVLFYNGEK